MKKIIRYDFDIDGGKYESDIGDYVKYEDYEDLRSSVEFITKKLENLYDYSGIHKIVMELKEAIGEENE